MAKLSLSCSSSFLQGYCRWILHPETKESIRTTYCYPGLLGIQCQLCILARDIRRSSNHLSASRPKRNDCHLTEKNCLPSLPHLTFIGFLLRCVYRYIVMRQMLLCNASINQRRN